MTTPIREIKVLPYNPQWVTMFKKEADRLQNVLPKGLVKIHHIGSTSVPNIAAKPVIDLMLEVSAVELLDQFDDVMNTLDYIPKGEFGIPGRRFYLKGLINRTHHIHAFERGSEGFIRHLALRDYLRAHSSEAEEYAKLKIQLADTHRYDNDGYCTGKFEYVQRLEQRALAWTIATNKTH